MRHVNAGILDFIDLFKKDNKLHSDFELCQEQGSWKYVVAKESEIIMIVIMAIKTIEESVMQIEYL